MHLFRVEAEKKQSWVSAIYKDQAWCQIVLYFLSSLVLCNAREGSQQSKNAILIVNILFFIHQASFVFNWSNTHLTIKKLHEKVDFPSILNAAHYSQRNFFKELKC